MKALRWLLLIVVLALVWYLRTWFHGPLLFLYATPVIWQVVIVTLVVHYLILARIPALNRSHLFQGEDTHFHFTHTMWLTPLLFLLLLIPGLLGAQWARGADLARSLQYHEVAGLPESAADLRLMPYEVARRYAMDSLQLSQYKLGTENIALIDGKLQWTFPLTPDGLVITFLRQNKGMVMVDATTQAKNADHVWQDMVIGEGMQIRDNLYWNLLRKRFFVSLDDPYYLPAPDGTDIFTVVGAIGYQLRFRWGLLYTVPYFDGVFLTDTAGGSELLAPQTAQEHPVLQGNRVFPESLARTFVDAHQYHLGILNRLFIHEDQIQIQDVRGPASPVNRQPYLMDTQDGLKWFISAEPYGASHGVFKIFLVDAVTGRIDVYHLPADETLTGPVRVVDYVRRANPIVDWSRFNAVEPLPFVRNGTLYWKLTVIPTDAAGIAYQVFVDAATNDVMELHSQAEVAAFLQGDLEPTAAVRTGDTPEAIIANIQELLQQIDQLLQQLPHELLPSVD